MNNELILAGLLDTYANLTQAWVAAKARHDATGDADAKAIATRLHVRLHRVDRMVNAAIGDVAAACDDTRGVIYDAAERARFDAIDAQEDARQARAEHAAAQRALAERDARAESERLRHLARQSLRGNVDIAA